MKKVLLIVAALLALGFVALTLLSQGRQPEPFPEGSESAQRLQPGPLTVIAEPQTFVDASRPTLAFENFAGSNERVMEGQLWYPAENTGGPYPLIVYSHGFTSTWEGGAYLAEHLTSLGYVVVSVSYPSTNFNAPGGPNVKDVVNQPLDVSFLIDTLLARNEDPQSPLFGKIDPTRIGATGISLGGMTSTLVAYHPITGDPRVSAALSIAGPTNTFTEVFFAHRDTEFLMLAADIDAIVPYASNAVPVLEKKPGARLVTVLGGSHTGFAGPAGSLRYMDNPDALGCYAVLQRIEDEPEEGWYDLIGPPEMGIDYNAVNELCLLDPLPVAINPLRQQMITQVTVAAFFQGQFAPRAEVRVAANEFIGSVIGSELNEVTAQ